MVQKTNGKEVITATRLKLNATMNSETVNVYAVPKETMMY
jgi:hypothetical protein